MKAARDSDVVAQGFQNRTYVCSCAYRARASAAIPPSQKRSFERTEEKERKRPNTGSFWRRCRPSQLWEEKPEFREVF